MQGTRRAHNYKQITFNKTASFVKMYINHYFKNRTNEKFRYKKKTITKNFAGGK